MPNAIKYNTGAETLALKKGNFWIGTGDVGKGLTSSTGYRNGINPPAGGYTIYLNKASNGPAIYTAANDSQLITLTNIIAGANYNNVNDCLNWFAGQSDKMVVNREYEPIVTNGLVLNLDAGFVPSYPRNGTSWCDSSPSGYNSTLYYGPTYDSANGGAIVFDGSNDVCQVPYYVPTNSSFTVSIWMQNYSNNNGQYVSQLNDSVAWDGFAIYNNGSGVRFALLKDYYSAIHLFLDSGSSIALNTWYNIVCLYNQTQGIIYINGSLSNSASYTGGFDATSYWNLGVGNRTTEGAPMNGKIASVQIYNRALSASEVLSNWNAMKGRFGL